jgi:hypothetical protein
MSVAAHAVMACLCGCLCEHLLHVHCRPQRMLPSAVLLGPAVKLSQALHGGWLRLVASGTQASRTYLCCIYRHILFVDLVPKAIL